VRRDRSLRDGLLCNHGSVPCCAAVRRPARRPRNHGTQARSGGPRVLQVTTETAFRLAALLAHGPSADRLARARTLALVLGTLPPEDPRRPPPELVAELAALVGDPFGTAALADGYRQRFELGPAAGLLCGPTSAPLHGAAEANPAAFATLCSRFGLLPPDSAGTGHVAAGLELVAALLAREGDLVEQGEEAAAAVVRRAVHGLVAERLGPQALAIAVRPEVVSAPFYREVFAWVADLVTRLAADCGVVLSPPAPAGGARA
jgi:hypothetical protein